MYATGYLIGSIGGAVACLVAAVLHRLAADLEAQAAVRPALVPLHVSGVSRASLN